MPIRQHKMLDAPIYIPSTAKNMKHGVHFLNSITIIFIITCLFCSVSVSASDDTSNLSRKITTATGKHEEVIQQLSSKFDQSFKKLQKLIDKEYGSYSKSLFLDEYFTPSLKFIERLQRRYQIKILQSYFLKEDPVFVWSTSGHSAAAGHGNLFNQSFTAIIGQTVQDVFQSVGVKFEARNYAMGGYGSFPELALCMASIYGNDVDIISWDFSMTDAGPTENLSGITLWGNRAGLISSFPMMFGFGSTNERIEKFMEFNSSVCLDYTKLDRRKEIIPDSTKTFDFDNIPLPLRYYNCKGHFESLDPCADMKFDTQRFCDHIEGQVSWHPGWKEHLFLGRLIGLYLVNNLKKAVSMLAEPTFFSRKYLEELLEKDITDQSDFLFRYDA